jgi:hypothetical protein
MIEVLRLSVENIRAYVALQEASRLTAGKAWNDTELPRIEDLRSTIDRVESLLARYEMEPSQARAPGSARGPGACKRHIRAPQAPNR